MMKLFVDLHEAFFDNEMGNKITMGIGIAMATVCMLLFYGVYTL